MGEIPEAVATTRPHSCPWGRKPGFDHVGPGNKVTATLGQSVQPGDVARLQVAFEGTPRTDNLVILCNGAGQYAAGRRAGLAFDR